MGAHRRLFQVGRSISVSSDCSSTSGSPISFIDCMTCSRSSWLVVPYGLFDAFLDRALRGHHRLNVEAGHELDIVHGENVRGKSTIAIVNEPQRGSEKNLIALCSLELGISFTTAGSISNRRD